MTKTVTIAATRTNGDPYAHHDVIVTLVAGSAGGVVGSNVIVSQTKVPLNASGQGSIVLATNDVEITSPSTSFYRFTVDGSSPTITRSVRITDALPSTISWTRSGIEVGDPTIPQRDVSSDYVTVGAESLTNYLAGLGGADVHSALMVIDPTTDLTTFTTTDIIDPITWATVVSDLARDILVGQTVAISSGANIGLYLVTASGPCTPLSPQPEIGEQIAVLVGGDGASPAVVIAVGTDGTVAPTEYRGVKGVVRSVNGGTGAVVVDAASVGADPAGTAASAISALGLGTAATKNVPATGDASPTEVVQGDDSRLTDDRDPTSHDHAASEIVSGTVAAARLGSGTADSTTFLRGDSAWAAPPGGSPITEVRVPAVMFVGSAGQAVAPTVRSIGSSAVRSRLGIVMADSVSTSTWATMPWMPWTSVDVYLDMFNMNASTGGVRWQVYLGGQATTHAVMSAHLATLAVSAAASGDDTTYGTRWTTAVATSVAVTQSDLLSVSVSRLGADAADTLAGSVYFMGLRFRQAGT